VCSSTRLHCAALQGLNATLCWPEAGLHMDCQCAQRGKEMGFVLIGGRPHGTARSEAGCQLGNWGEAQQYIISHDMTRHVLT
jgi:hypothetical protein